MTSNDEEEVDELISQLGEDLVKSFHEQFAQNQNHPIPPGSKLVVKDTR